jgi:hypothetical protein
VIPGNGWITIRSRRTSPTLLLLHSVPPGGVHRVLR